MGEEIRVWYDKEGDYLEVLFEKRAGYFKETENDAVMEKVGKEGIVFTPFLVINVVRFGREPGQTAEDGLGGSAAGAGRRSRPGVAGR
jgi:hypothetical protein